MLLVVAKWFDECPKFVDNEHGRNLWIMVTVEGPAEDLLIIEIENAANVEQSQK